MGIGLSNGLISDMVERWRVHRLEGKVMGKAENNTDAIRGVLDAAHVLHGDLQPGRRGVLLDEGSVAVEACFALGGGHRQRRVELQRGRGGVRMGSGGVSDGGSCVPARRSARG